MRKLIVSSLLVLVLLTSAALPAFADSFPYAFSYDGTKGVYPIPAPKSALVYAMIEQTQYYRTNNPTISGTKCNYGGRKTKTTSGNSIFTVVSFSGTTGRTVEGQALYNNSPSVGAN